MALSEQYLIIIVTIISLRENEDLIEKNIKIINRMTKERNNVNYDICRWMRKKNRHYRHDIYNENDTFSFLREL